MPPFLRQSAASGSGGVWLGDPTQPFTNPVQSGNALAGFVCARGECSTFSVSDISDTLGNHWTNIAQDSSTGIRGIGYTLGSAPGGDTVTFAGTGLCGFTYDPCTIVAEIAGISSFGGLTTTIGTSSVASGSVTTPSGTYNFATTTSYGAWVLSLMYFVGINDGTGLILAIPFAPNENFGQDSIPGWQLDAFNLHSGLYTISVAPTPPAPVRVFVNTGPTKRGW